MRYLLISVLHIFLQVWLASAAVYVPSAGPVYITPEKDQAASSIEEATPSPTPSVSSNADVIMTTQTVYGFLDFTTTMGNTVMVFSPNSAAPVVVSTESSKPEEVTKVEVIETKPIETTPQSVEEIKPSKTIVEQKTNEKKNSNDKKSQEKKVVSSVFAVVSSPFVEEVKEEKTEKTPVKEEIKEEVQKVESKIVKQENIVVKEERIEKPEKKDDVVEKKKPVVFTKVEIREGPTEEKVEKVPKFTTVESVKESVSQEKSVRVEPKVEKKAPVITTKVEVKTSESSDEPREVKEEQKVSNVRVEVVTHREEVEERGTTESDVDSEPAVEVTGILKPLTILSSKVEVVAEEPATIVGNNIGETPEYYDFLSRQPSEVVDETFRVIDLKPSAPNKVYQKPLRTYDGKLNIRPSKNNPLNNDELQPTGLVTSLGGTIVQDGLTTVHETSVLGTFVNGKYAQVLQSTSHIYQNNKKIKPTPAHQSKILKTVGPSLGGIDKPKKNVNIEATPTPSSLEDDNSLPLESLFHSNPSGNLIRQSRRPAVGNGQFKNRYNAINRKQNVDDYVTSEESDNENLDYPSTTSSYRKNKYGNQNNNGATAPGTNSGGRNVNKFQNNRFQKPPGPSAPELATYSVFSEPASTAAPSLGSGGRRFSPSGNGRRKSNKEKEYSYKDESSGKSDRSRGFKNKENAKIVASNVESSTSSSIYKFKLQRPSGRWQYKTTPKPRVAIRRTDDNLDNSTLSNQPAQLIPDIQIDPDQEISGSGIFPALQHDQDDAVVQDIVPTVAAETLKVAISTPADFKDVYYEIATIRSPYSFQVGTVKNTRFVTVTSTIEKSLVEPTQSINPSEPLSENILATSTANAYDKEPPLDSSIVTLPPIGLAGDQETPPLETMTESFSTTQLMLKTHILPVLKAGNTSLYTLVQSYHITRLVSAVKTLPPMEVYQFVPSKTLNEFNTRLDEAGSELHLELDFGDNNDADDERHPNAMKAILSDLDVSNIGSDFSLSDVDKSKIPEQHLRSKKAHNLPGGPTTQPQISPKILAELPPELQQQLALLKLLNPNAIPSPLLATSKPIYKVETVYESHVIPLLNGQSTTLSRPVATITKTEYEPASTAIPQVPQIPQIPQLPLQQLPILPQQPIITSTPVVQQTMVTETDSKILKLTFGAKTAYTTIFSTKVVPTIVTSFVTQPVQPTAAYPGFYNPAFGNFPYLG